MAISQRSQNQKVFESLRKGDLIEFNRGYYSHWGVFVGAGEVVHLAGEDDDGINASQPGHVFSIGGKIFDKARVCKENFWNIVGNNPATVNNEKDSTRSSLDSDNIVKRALASIGEVGYNVFTKNCEHFAKWCRYNVAESDQVDHVVKGLFLGGAALLGGLAIYGACKEKEKKRKQ